MKEIYIPKEMTVRFYFNGETPKTNSSGTPLKEDMRIIEKNRAELAVHRKGS